MSNGRVLVNELKLLLSGVDNLLNTLILFILMISVALFTIKDTEMIKILPTILWICGISTVHMSMCHLLGNDYGNGSLEQILIQNCIPELVIFFKILLHWVYVGIPVSLISVFIDFIILDNDLYSTLGLGFSLGISLLVISFISAVGHALALGKNGGVIIAQVLTLPIMIPILIYFNLLFDHFKGGVYDEYIMLLGILVISVIPVSLVFILYAIRLAVEHD
ncbi:heme exporter protein CcmB [Ehrlichia ruminantium]|uniref:Heme exporter protein B n=1 Tax=Ehrlichia ruminantium (strain Welgevonden) TaxID=254945 RepID=A0A0H3M7C9_EHRRW|nr:heme exporter protein CcmB [Ehrlichia ruminantium]QLK54716.1 heme ABC transporter permease CcmB [Ehrlichia ruminantium]QLK55635.1 heme ABC transporter permease CcmB [Ehrlichia ruminantium]QLK56555.1 heme ABC transporter permease CcmB [Ehrlichia ruminantium]UOD99736.1 heme exporter protein CcmB [Ehrlichia ruminantium]CAH57754.1 putative heme exporter protein B [Ehrlichia ruminantium str. Welgevonden]